MIISLAIRSCLPESVSRILNSSASTLGCQAQLCRLTRVLFPEACNQLHYYHSLCIRAPQGADAMVHAGLSWVHDGQ